MPAPSILPLINAAGLALAIVSHHAHLVPGRLRRGSSSCDHDPLDRDVRRDIADLPLDHDAPLVRTV